MSDFGYVVSFLILVLGLSIVPSCIKGMNDLEMAKAGMEQVMQSTTNRSGKVYSRVLWQKAE